MTRLDYLNHKYALRLLFLVCILLVASFTRAQEVSIIIEGNNYSRGATISADGRFVAFESAATNFVAPDTNRMPDVFVHDLQTGETTRVSVTSDGTEANSWSYNPTISADGRFVAFESVASNLVAGDSNEETDIFVHDRQTGKTTRVSVASDGTEGVSSLGIPSNAVGSHNSSISADGRFVAFQSANAKLVDGDSNEAIDVFVHDRQTGETTRVSVASNGTEGNHNSSSPTISADGRFIVFTSIASNLVADDTYSCGEGDRNSELDNCPDVFVHDRQTGETTRVSVASDGTEGDKPSGTPSISGDGRYVTFISEATNLVLEDTNRTSDVVVFLHDRQTGETIVVSTLSNRAAHGWEPSISIDGRVVVFNSKLNLVEEDTNRLGDIFVYDLNTGEITRVSVASDGTQADARSDQPAVSGNGRYIVFHSSASNLVTGDTNNQDDVFMHDRQTGETIRVSVGSG